MAQTLYNLEVEALPLEIPNEFVVDLSQLVDANLVIRAGELMLESNVTLVTDPDAVVVRVDAGRFATAQTAEGEDSGASSDSVEVDGSN